MGVVLLTVLFSEFVLEPFSTESELPASDSPEPDADPPVLLDVASPEWLSGLELPAASLSVAEFELPESELLSKAESEPKLSEIALLSELTENELLSNLLELPDVLELSDDELLPELLVPELLEFPEPELLAPLPEPESELLEAELAEDEPVEEPELLELLELVDDEPLPEPLELVEDELLAALPEPELELVELELVELELVVTDASLAGAPPEISSADAFIPLMEKAVAAMIPIATRSLDFIFTSPSDYQSLYFRAFYLSMLHSLCCILL